jgi:hypothetical protein
LTELGVPCPSAVDPERNRHRDGDTWTLRTVAVILANPRYTGRQVWNRQGSGSQHPMGSERGPCQPGNWRFRRRPRIRPW